jgi:hypothetical protein
MMLVTLELKARALVGRSAAAFSATAAGPVLTVEEI